MKKIVCIIAMFIICHAVCNASITTATATEKRCSALDANSKPITLYECYTSDNERVLLDNVTPGKTYIVLIDNNGTFDENDDLIIRLF